MEKVNVALIASGSGTDADAIMNAWRNGGIPNANIAVLISTKEGAGCLDKAKTLGVNRETVDAKALGLDEDGFNERVREIIQEYEVNLVFLVGCIKRMNPEIIQVAMFNIHPADTEKYGGDGMYGLEVHSRVVWDAVDQIDRGKKVLGQDRFFTYPTIHEVVYDYDSGALLLIGAVEIPEATLRKVVDDDAEIDDAAEELQQVVLKHEWLMLPAAVNMAALKILSE